MKIAVPTNELRVGMFVILSGSWMNHPFLRSRFRLSSEEQLRELHRCGLKEVMVDFARSDSPQPAPPATELAYVSHNDAPGSLSGKPVFDPKDLPPPAVWTPENLVAAELREAIYDRKMPPEQKSQAIYHHSREMMERLLEAPSVENIQAGKEAIRDISDLVLADSETAWALLQITTHDFYTYTHSVNVGITGLMLAKALFGGSDGHDMHELAAGFFLHDLGKVMIDPAIINKPERLSEAEMKRMRIHPYQGYKILRDANALSEECRIIVMEHHELYDGSGYPKRLGGDQIHLYGRICCIADVFDALTAERSYKQGMTPFDALTLMRDAMPNHFDKQLFSSFVGLFRR